MDTRNIKSFGLVIAFVTLTCSCTSNHGTQLDKTTTAQPVRSQTATEVQRDGEPEIVRVEKVFNGPQVKTVLAGNKNGSYSLSCNITADGCLTPTPGMDYYVITKDTKWRLKGAEGAIDLQFIQDFSVSYTNRENIGLVAVELEQRRGLAIYWLNSWSGK